jgi:hypothetical protein
MMMSVAWSAMNTSPEPVTFITLTPSPVTAFLSILDMPPEPVFSKRASPWYPTIEPVRACTGPYARLILSNFLFWWTNWSVASASENVVSSLQWIGMFHPRHVRWCALAQYRT